LHRFKAERGKRRKSPKDAYRDEHFHGGLHQKSIFEHRHKETDQHASRHVYDERSKWKRTVNGLVDEPSDCIPQHGSDATSGKNEYHLFHSVSSCLFSASFRTKYRHQEGPLKIKVDRNVDDNEFSITIGLEAPASLSVRRVTLTLDCSG